MQKSDDWAFALSDPRCRDSAQVGGKAAELHRLLHEGFPVPEAFVVPIAAFARHVPEPDPVNAPPRPTVSAPLSAILASICTRLCPVDGDRLAVRSSALGEDGAQRSYPGVHSTYYYVTAESVDKALVDCWMSLWADPAIAYRRQLDAPGERPAMAVIVQRMIQAERSGVCFTKDPTGTHPDAALLEASWGLGAALVDGRVSPDRFWIDAGGAVLDGRISRKRLKVAERLDDANASRLEPVPLNRQTRPTLSDIEAAQIAAIARQIASGRGREQDLEWAIDGDELFVLQSRPITVNAAPAAPPVDGRFVLFKPAVENFSEPLTPMTVDLFRRVLPPFGCFIHGRYYIDADAAARLLPWKLDDEALRDALLLRRLPDERRMDLSGIARLGGLGLLAYLTTGIGWHRTAHLPASRLEAFEARVEQVLAGDADPLTTLRRLLLNKHPFRPMGEFPVQANLAAARYFLLLYVLQRLLDRFAPTFDQSKLGILCSGGADMLSQQMVESIRSLARTAAADEKLARTLIDAPDDLVAQVTRLPEPHPFSTEFAQFLRRFGHRAVRELELATPRWREEPNAVLAMVRAYLEGGESRRVDAHGLTLAAEDELRHALARRWQRWTVERLLGRVRYYVALRENTRHFHTMALAAVREKLKRLERVLLDDGRLRCEDDIFFLEHDEASALERGALGWTDVEARIRDRRLRHQRLSQQPPAESFNLAISTPRAAASDSVLTGDCASPGVATGRARIIRDPSVAGDLKPGEVLVAPYTDPAWTPLFPRAAAIVVEIGSYLSHAGTLAREYQIPCLVDVSDCTRRIRNGQELRINADEGWVEIVS